MFKLVGFFLALLVLVSSATSDTTDPDIKLDDDKEHVDIIVTMKESNSPVLRQLSARSFPSREERLNSVATEAQEHASKSQESLLSFLSTEGQSRAGTGKVEPKVTSLWITNQVAIQNADMALIKELSGRPDVGKVELISRSIEMEEPVDDPDSEGDSDDGEDGPWGIANMNVPLVWEKGIRGEGVVVANMDSGVRHTHEALASNFIGEGGWLDVGVEKHPEPRDNSGHGTATMSLIAGTTRNVGVAPAARWMTCGNVREPGTPSSVFDWVLCAQWLACPGGRPKEGEDPGARRNCSQAPHVINHSWGGSNDDLFDKAILYYHAAGVIPVFAVHNGGPDCSTLAYPGAFSYVIGVGAITKNNTVVDYSSRGPPEHDMDLIKPDLVAPGDRVRAANFTSDNGYVSESGTSYAAPYVTGVVALMLSKNPTLSYKQVKEILLAGTVPTVSNGEFCGGKPDDEFPNFIAGYGRLDANKAIEYMDTMTK